MIVATWRICKWFILQIFLFYGMPYLWQNHFNTETIVLILLYTVSYSIYWECVPDKKKFRWILCPYVVYSIIAVILCCSIEAWGVSVWFSLLLPLYGAIFVFVTKISEKYFRKINERYRFGRVMTYTILAIVLVTIKTICVSWERSKQDSIENEKEDILARKNYCKHPIKYPLSSIFFRSIFAQKRLCEK